MNQFLTFVFDEEAEPVPAEVLREVLRFTGLMAQDKNYDDTPRTMAEVAGEFQGSLVTIGFSKAEEQDIREYYEGDLVGAEIFKVPEGGRPVASWHSDVDQVLYYYPEKEGTDRFFWTEP